MKLSIIVPVYNVEQYIQECLDSIYNQGLDNSEFEVLLINDGSTDSSLAILEAYDKEGKNIKIISQPNQGLSGARNTGIANCIGEYIYFIDSDDFLLNNSLSKLLNYATEFNMDFCGFESVRRSTRYLYSEEESLNELVVAAEGDGYELIQKHQYNNSACMYLVKKQLIDKNNHLFERDRNCEDGMFTSKLLTYVKKGVIFKNNIYQYYFNPKSIVNTANVDKSVKMIEDMFFTINYFDKVIKEIPADKKELVFQRLANRQQSYLFFCIIRMIKLGYSYDEIILKIKSKIDNSQLVYPFRNFKGYDAKGKLLVLFFNNEFLFKTMLFLNRKLNVI